MDIEGRDDERLCACCFSAKENERFSSVCLDYRRVNASAVRDTFEKHLSDLADVPFWQLKQNFTQITISICLLPVTSVPSALYLQIQEKLMSYQLLSSHSLTLRKTFREHRPMPKMKQALLIALIFRTDASASAIGGGIGRG